MYNYFDSIFNIIIDIDVKKVDDGEAYNVNHHESW